MSDAAFLVRFFRVVPPVPVVMNVAFAASAVSAAAALGLHASDPYAALAPVFLLQTLAASSGFAVPARRGQYDLLLTRGVSRLRIGVAHLVASTLPGLLCWTSIAVLEAMTAGNAARISLSSGTIAGLLIVSGVSWAVSVPFPRRTGGIVWLLIAVAPINHDRLPPTVGGLVLPWTLVGTDAFSDLALMSLAADAAVVAIVVACALGWICRSDISLQVAQ